MGPNCKKNKAPFGVTTKRFNKIGFHPELDVSGAMKREVTKAGPGSYNVKFVTCTAKRGISWKAKVETEEFSRVLGYKNAKLLQEREFDKTLRGPGCNDLNEEYLKRDFSVIPNTGFGTGDRFPPEKPNRITPSPSIDRLVNKVVSLRGPYDLFTGPRDDTTIKNHFTPSNVKTPEYGYIEPSSTDVLLHHPSKQRCGKFLKAPRYSKKPSVRTMLNDLSLCYRDPGDPGPAHYEVKFKSIAVKKKSMYPFDTSKLYCRPPLQWSIFPGPGRYNPKAPKCTKVKRPSWIFLSKAQRNLYTFTTYTDF